MFIYIYIYTYTCRYYHVYTCYYMSYCYVYGFGQDVSKETSLQNPQLYKLGLQNSYLSFRVAAWPRAQQSVPEFTYK